MSRIEKLADDYARHSPRAVSVLDAPAISYTAGYRCALADMQSDLALRAWQNFVVGHIAQTCSVPLANEILAAVAKELEK